MNLVSALLALQDDKGHLEEDDLRGLSEATGRPLHEIEGLCSFYPHLRREPPAARRVRVCRDVACKLSGGEQQLAELRASLDDSSDLSIEEVSCLGRCEIAPACTVDEVPMPSGAAVEALADEGVAARWAEAAASPPERRWKMDPYAGGDEPYGVLREWVSRSDPDALIARIDASGLRGMGGAGFPTGRKWRLVADQPAEPRYVVCNADESEPGTFKDRSLLESFPHLVIEGIVLAGLAIGSERGWIFIRHEFVEALRTLRRALEEARTAGALGASIFGSGRAFEIEIFVSPGGYILGEETALLEALEGRRGEPRNRPPYPGQSGLYGQPTLINNVETLAHVPRVLRTGKAGLKLYSVSGDVERPGVVEAPIGTTLRELIERCGGMREGKRLQAFLPGGASTGFLPAERADVRLDWDSLREAGTALGSAAVVVVAEGTNLRELAGNLVRFFRNESCGKCVPCRVGTEKAVGMIELGDDESLESLRLLDETLRDTSICGLGQAALTPILSVLDRFPAERREEA
jgi:NADH:ubiquinone oxidoreductase subunit F (NADH-binding)/NADH:ubiquinone oxidoreductase subunit E